MGTTATKKALDPHFVPEPEALKILDSELTNIDTVDETDESKTPSLEDWARISPTIREYVDTFKTEEGKKELAELDHNIELLPEPEPTPLPVDESALLPEPDEETPELVAWLDEAHANPEPQFTQDNLLKVLLDEDKPEE